MSQLVAYTFVTLIDYTLISLAVKFIYEFDILIVDKFTYLLDSVNDNEPEYLEPIKSILCNAGDSIFETATL